MTHTSQFRQVTTPSGKKAYEAWAALWNDRSKHIVIAAPSLGALEDKWKNITGLTLIVENVQHVWIVAATEGEMQDAMTKPGKANEPCSVLGCANEASFIIERKGYCYAHRR